MTLRDKLYLRFGLFHSRYGRMWCAFLEGVILGTILLILLTKRGKLFKRGHGSTCRGLQAESG